MAASGAPARRKASKAMSSPDSPGRCANAANGSAALMTREIFHAKFRLMSKLPSDDLRRGRVRSDGLVQLDQRAAYALERPLRVFDDG
jgi:hypothetical protein